MDITASLLSRIPRDLLDEFVDTLREHFDDDDVDSDLWGPAPTHGEVQEAALWRLHARLAHRDEAVQDSLPMHTLARIWNKAPDELAESARSGSLIAIRRRDDWYFPLWQFDSSLTPLPGVDKLLRTFPGGATGLSLWMVAPNLELENQTPAAVLQRGDVAAVLRAASDLAVSGS